MTKTIISYGAILISCSLLLSCKKDNNTTNNNNSSNNNNTTSPAAFFSALVDQNNFPTADIQFTMAKYVSSTKMLQIIGQPKDQKETIVLSFVSTNGKITSVTDWNQGEYKFGSNSTGAINYVCSGEYNKWNGSGYEQWFTDGAQNEGTIQISSNDGTKIKGTFTFKAAYKNTNGSHNTANIKSITAGQFDVEIKTL